MQNSKMRELMEEIVLEIFKTHASGQKEYADDEDNVFANFERISYQMNVEREFVLWVYLMKHIDGIASYINGHESQREDVRGRITDAIVYLMLLWGMIESKEYPTQQSLGDETI